MGYGYGGYPTNAGYYPAPPMPDQLAQLRGGQYPPQMNYQQAPAQQAQTMPQMQQMPPVVQPQQPSISGPVYVNGEAGARGYLVAPNTTVILFDADPDGHTFWLKTGDAAGMPSIRAFDYTERTAQGKPAETASAADYVTREEWNTLKERADALADELEQLKARRTATQKKTAKEEDE